MLFTNSKSFIYLAVVVRAIYMKRKSQETQKQKTLLISFFPSIYTILVLFYFFQFDLKITEFWFVEFMISIKKNMYSSKNLQYFNFCLFSYCIYFVIISSFFSSILLFHLFVQWGKADDTCIDRILFDLIS